MQPSCTSTWQFSTFQPSSVLPSKRLTNFSSALGASWASEHAGEQQGRGNQGSHLHGAGLRGVEQAVSGLRRQAPGKTDAAVATRAKVDG